MSEVNICTKTGLRVGDMVRALEPGPRRYGIVIEIIRSDFLPPVARILYSSGDLEKEYIDELELVPHASR